MDHKNLEYLRDEKWLNPRLVHWALYFTWFNFSISYYPETTHSSVSIPHLKVMRNSSPSFYPRFLWTWFNGHWTKACLKPSWCDISLSTGYHPQTNRQTEVSENLLSSRPELLKSISTLGQVGIEFPPPTIGLTQFQCILYFQPSLFPWSGEPFKPLY